MWRRRRTTSSLPTSTTGPSSTTSSTGRRSRLPPVAGPGRPRPTDAPAPRAVAPGQGGATPTLPPAVAQRATLIQQGKAPVPPSATINPAARAGLPGARAGRKAERAAAGQCAGRAAFDPALAEDQRAAGSGCQGRATRASERCGVARRGQSERQACAGRDASGISGSGCARRGLPAPGPPSVRRLPPLRPAAETGRSAGRVAAPPAGAAAPPKPAAALRRDLSCSLNCGERRRRLRCMWQGRRRRRPASLRRATAADGRPATAEDGRAAAATEDGCSAPTHGRAAAPRMAAPPPREWRPRRPGWLRHRRVRLRRRQPRSARRALDADC